MVERELFLAPFIEFNRMWEKSAGLVDASGDWRKLAQTAEAKMVVGRAESSGKELLLLRIDHANGRSRMRTR